MPRWRAWTEPAALLERAAKSIADESAAVSAQASRDAQHATTASLVLMLVVLGVAMVGAFLFSRAILRPLDRAVACAQAVAEGDLTRRRRAGRDEIADLLRALQTMQTSLSGVVLEVRTHAEAVATASRSRRAITTCRRGPRRRPRRSRRRPPA